MKIWSADFQWTSAFIDTYYLGIIWNKHLKALVFLYAFEESKSTAICFRLFAMIQTCTYLYSSMYFPRWV